MTHSIHSDEYKVIKAKFFMLIDADLPKEIGDQLFASDIIPEAVHEDLFDHSSTPKEKSRKLVKAVLKAIEENRAVFRDFCTILRDSDKSNVTRLEKILQDDLDAMKNSQEESKTDGGITTSSNFTQLKQELELLRKSLLQSDSNVDTKHSLIKEFIGRFIRESLESGEEHKNVQLCLEQLCISDMLVPQNLQEWCFNELDKQNSMLNPIVVGSSSQDHSGNTDVPSRLFSKDNVYHAILATFAVFSYDSETYRSFFEKNPHEFDELSMSESSNVVMGRYLLARKKKILFVAFNGEPKLISWQQKKYNSFDEGVLNEKERIPIRFFVEHLRNGEDYQIIFTGFSFGASLALAVYAELWSQSCLRICDLEESVAYFGFGAPLFSISSVKSIAAECQALLYNSHIFYLEDDILPRLFQCVDFSNETNAASEQGKLYPGTVAENVVHFLTKLQNIHCYEEEVAEDVIRSLKAALKLAVPSFQDKASIFGFIYNIYQVHDHEETYKMSEPLTDPENLQYPNAVLIDTLKITDLFIKHSLREYRSLIESSFLNSPCHGGIYEFPKSSGTVLPELTSLKPNVTKANFFRHADEVAIVFEGTDLWFCHKVEVSAGRKPIIIEAKGQDTTMRSISFNYTPKNPNDLIVNERISQLAITVHSHFCKSFKLEIEAQKMEDYTLSLRQRQLAKFTPSEVIRLSLLSAMLEVLPESSTSGRPHRSNRFSVVCKFLEDVTRIVPIESFFDAIGGNESIENSFLCAETLISSKFKPNPSFFLLHSLHNAHVRLSTGIKPALLQKAQNQLIGELTDGVSPILCSHQVLENEVIVFAGKGRFHNDSVSFGKKKSNKTELHFQSDIIFDALPESATASDIYRIRRQIKIPKPPDAIKIATKGNKDTVITHLKKMAESVEKGYYNRKHTDIICGANIAELYPHKEMPASAILKPPIDFLKESRSKLIELQRKAQQELALVLNNDDNRIEHYNEEMIEILNKLMSQDVAICLSLLGAFMERQIQVPFVNSLSETAHVLQTAKSSSTVGVWSLFSLNMLDFQSIVKSRNGRLCIEVQEYVEGILNRKRDNHKRPASPDRGGYAGKLQFLMVSMGKTVSCNSQYISYSLERQLPKLCERYGITTNSRVAEIVEGWNSKFSDNILRHVVIGFRPLLARWLLWSLNIHKLREELASNITVGIVGLSKSGKSCLMKNLFNLSVAVSGTSRTQRTTVPFMYNLEGTVNGLSIVDFPGVDDHDKAVVNISSIFLQLAQIVVLVIDYKRIFTQAAMDWIKQLDKSGVPVLLCLTHGDRLYTEKCINKKGKLLYKDDDARRVIGNEFEEFKKALPTCPPTRTVVLCSFCQNLDSNLNSDDGRQTLAKAGIHSLSAVGNWLVERLKDEQKSIADELQKYFDKVNSQDDYKAQLQLKDQKENNEIEIPKFLREVKVYADKSFSVNTTNEAKHTYLSWDGYGVKIVIPPGALKEGVSCTIALSAVHVNKYEIPQFEDYEVVSAFYWVAASHKFLKPVDLIIKHCVRLETENEVAQMEVVSARCNQEELPYSFQKRKAVFELKSRKSRISTKQFSLFTIINNLSCGLSSFPTLMPSLLHNIYYVYMIFGQKSKQLCNQWLFDFFFLKDFDPLIMKLKNTKKDWVERGPVVSFNFSNDSSRHIDVVLSSVPDNDHWDITKSPDKIKKDFIDRANEGMNPQCCRVTFTWVGGGDPTPIKDFPVILKGITAGMSLPLVKISIPLNDGTSLCTNSSAKHCLAAADKNIPLNNVKEKLIEESQLLDVFIFIKPHSNRWKELGRELEVSMNKRDELRKDSSLSDEDRLEKILSFWITSRKVPVTWGFLIQTLKKVELCSIAEEIEMSLV